MPKLSDTMTEGVVAAWHKKVGDKVKSGELLAEIETDKATMEFESFVDGVLLYIGIQKGQSAPVDSLLAIFGKEGEDVSALIASGSEPVAAAPAAVAAPTPSPAPAPAAVAVAPAPVAVQAVSSNGQLKASPLAKKMAESKGISLQHLQGSGDGGRIVKRDVDAFQPGTMTLPAAAGVESFTEEHVSQMRKTIARRLAESKFSAPHFYLTMEIDMDNAIASRKKSQNMLDKITLIVIELFVPVCQILP
jgi:pyruvate dehydrogenase E2 component (dihydrolipoamide acetyltransferase)